MKENRSHFPENSSFFSVTRDRKIEKILGERSEYDKLALQISDKPFTN